MNEEEKKAIESLRKNRGVSFAQADIISNLIDKQQKEITRLKKDKEILYRVIDELKENNSHITKEFVDFVNSHYIHKDRIREFISKYTKETLKDFSPYIRDNSTFEKERKSGQLRILQKIKKELLEE